MNRLLDRMLKAIILTISLIVMISLMPASKSYADVSNDLEGYYNNIVQKEIHHTNIPQYANRYNTEESIDPITGSLTLKCTDINLPGKDGLDLKIGRIYNSSEDECDKAVDSSGYLKYNPISRPEPYYYVFASYHNTTRAYTFNKARYNLGAGWSFAFPSIQLSDNNMYYHTGNGSTYEIKYDSGTYYFKDYQGKDYQFYNQFFDYISGEEIRFKLIDSSKTASYFSADGRIIRIQDRFGNQINFSYTMMYNMIGNTSCRLISEIVDSVGRTVTFSYTGNNIEVTVQAPGETDTINTIYKRTPLTKNAGSNTYQYLVLSSVEDNAGKSTYYENYMVNNTWPSEKFSLLTKDYFDEAYMDRYLIGAIIYPGSKTIYEYEKTTRNLGDDGLTEAYRIKSRYDQIQRKNSNTNAYEWISNNNRMDYYYNGDYTGYPTYAKEEDIPDTFRFSTEITMSNGIKTKNLYNKEKQQTQIETVASNNELKITKYLEYDTNFKFKPIKIETSEYDGDRVLVRTLYQGTTYTAFGGISTSTLPLTAAQYNNSSIKDKYTTTCFYEDSNFPYFITKKQWYQSDTKMLSETYSYNSLGRIISQTNAKSQTINYNYYDDANNKVVEVTTNLENGKVLKTKSIYGSETGYAFPKEEVTYYTDQGVQKTSKISKAYYLLTGLVKSETDNEEKTTSYTYDKLGRVTRITLPEFKNLSNINNPVSKFFYYYEGYFSDYNMNTPYVGIYGTRIYSKDGYASYYDNYSSILYDAYGNVRHESEESKEEVYITKAIYDYDLMQRVIAVKDAAGNMMTQSYNPWGQVNEITDASGNLYVKNYDIVNNKVAGYFVPKDNISAYRANTTLNTYKQNYGEIYYDQFGRTTERRVYENWPSLNGSLSELYRYDISGNVISYTDPKRNLNEGGVSVSYKYDALNQLVEVKNALNQLTLIDYSILGGISSIKLKENTSSTTSIQLYTKAYDELGRLLSKADPSDQVTQYSYNSLGLVNGTKDRNGNNWSASYDEINQLKISSITSADNSSSLTHLYNYTNPHGYTDETLQVNGIQTTANHYTYDEFGQIIQKNITGSDVANSNLKMQYDTSGRLNNIGIGVQDSNYFYTNYTYNKERLEKVQTNGQQTTSSSDSDYALYEYYPDGKLKKITYPKLNDNTYLTTEYSYNALGRMTDMSNKKSNTVLSQFTYTYDANGNILTVNDGLTTKTYTYDKLNRLITIQPQVGDKIVYTYDLRGNRITSSNSDTLSNIQNTSYKYDLENKLNQVTKGTNTTSMTYSADGMRVKKVTGSNATSYMYNLAGNVMSMETTVNGNTSRDNYVWGPDRVLAGSKAGNQAYYYLYNGHGDVIQIIDKNGNIVNNYAYDEWGNSQRVNLLAGSTEIGKFENASTSGSSLVNVVNPQTGKNTRAIRLNAGHHVPVISSEVMNLKSNTEYVLEFDYWSDGDNISFDCDLHPDDLPQIFPTAKKSVQHYEWEFSSNSSNMNNALIRFFNDLAVPNPANIYITNINLYEKNSELNDTNPFRYAGEVYDKETGLYYLRARYYDPAIGRFINEDTYEGQVNNPLTLNLYSYCWNNPITLIDPSGHAPSAKWAEKWNAIWSSGPIDAVTVKKAASQAYNLAIDYAKKHGFVKDGIVLMTDNEVDAFRHFSWNYISVQKGVSSNDVSNITTYHEETASTKLWTDNKGQSYYKVNLSSLMDLYNNYIGRMYAALNTGETPEQAFQSCLEMGIVITSLDQVAIVLGFNPDWIVPAYVDSAGVYHEAYVIVNGGVKENPYDMIVVNNNYETKQ